MHMIEVSLLRIPPSPRAKDPVKPVPLPIVRATPQARSSHHSAMHHAARRPSRGIKRAVPRPARLPVPKEAPLIASTTMAPPATTKNPTVPEKKLLTATTKIAPDLISPDQDSVKPMPPQVGNPFQSLAPPAPVAAAPSPPPSGEAKSGAGTGDSGQSSGDSGGAGNGYGPFGIGNGTGGGTRHIVYVIDISLSMASRLETVKNEMRKSLSGLEHGETFSVLAFGGTVSWFDSQLDPATPNTVNQAKGYLDTLQLREGTDLQSALFQALDMPGVNVIVVMTDGVPTEGETDFKAIARNVRKRNRDIRARIYTVGLVGKNPDGTDDSFEATKLLQQLAADSGGEFELRSVGVAAPDD